LNIKEFNTTSLLKEKFSIILYRPNIDYDFKSNENAIRSAEEQI
jgi:hypothetical protein